MAVWQVSVELIPNSWVKEHGHSTDALYDEDGFHDTSKTWVQNQPVQNLETLFGKFLLQAESSDEQVTNWGCDKMHDINVWYENRAVVSIGLRIDMREVDNEFLLKVIEATSKLNCQLFITGQRIIVEPNIFTFKKLLLKSNAAKFVKNPIEFIQSIDSE